MSIVAIPMIAGLGFGDALDDAIQVAADGKNWGPTDQLGWVQRDLDVTESLVNLGAITVADVRKSIFQAQAYINQIPTTDDGQRQAWASALGGELDKLSAYSAGSPSPPDLWPGERRTIEGAYSWAAGDGAALELEAAKAQAGADVLDHMLGSAGSAAAHFGDGLEKTLQDSVKWLAIGALAIGAVMVLPQLIGGVQQLTRRGR